MLSPSLPCPSSRPEQDPKLSQCPLSPAATASSHRKLPSREVKPLPHQFEKCDVQDLIELIASMLNRLISHNDQIPLSSTSLTRFHSRSPPSILIKDYLDRIYRYTNLESICLLLILTHIDRICENLANFTICSLTVHRFSITSVTVGSKSICDSFYSNSRYAKVGGISLAEINVLEREFLIAIDYRLMTSMDALNRYYISLIQSHSQYTLMPGPIPKSVVVEPRLIHPDKEKSLQEENASQLAVERQNYMKQVDYGTQSETVDRNGHTRSRDGTQTTGPTDVRKVIKSHEALCPPPILPDCIQTDAE